MLKETLIFAAGAAAGGAIAYMAVNNKFQKRYEEDYANWNANRAQTEHEPQNDIQLVEDPFRKEEPLVDEKTFGEFAHEYGGDSIIPTENPWPMKIFQAEAASNLPDDILPEEHPAEGPAEKPMFISESEFSEKKMWYDKIELYYYGVDGILCDDCEEICTSDVYDLLGPEAIAEARDTHENVYIRNEKAAQDYMIIYCNSSYADTHDLL